MTERRITCEVSTKCAYRPYVTVWANGATAESMKPFNPITVTCRRHIGMIIDHALRRTSDVRVKGVSQ